MTSKKRIVLIILGIIYVAFFVEFIIHLGSDQDSNNTINRTMTAAETNISEKSTRKHASDLPSYNPTTNGNGPEAGSLAFQTGGPQSSKINSGQGRSDPVNQELPNDPPLRDTEEIKHRIYDMKIEYLDDLEALEAIIQTGDADQTSFWAGDWHSADDWKRRNDSFQLNIDDDGLLSFLTDDGIHQPSAAFTFDEKKREFYWEEDYYGKIISHRAKFVTPNTLLIIKTSGIKVNLDIYEKATP